MARDEEEELNQMVMNLAQMPVDTLLAKLPQADDNTRALIGMALLNRGKLIAGYVSASMRAASGPDAKQASFMLEFYREQLPGQDPTGEEATTAFGKGVEVLRATEHYAANHESMESQFTDGEAELANMLNGKLSASELAGVKLAEAHLAKSSGSGNMAGKQDHWLTPQGPPCSGLTQRRRHF